MILALYQTDADLVKMLTNIPASDQMAKFIIQKQSKETGQKKPVPGPVPIKDPELDVFLLLD